MKFRGLVGAGLALRPPLFRGFSGGKLHRFRGKGNSADEARFSNMEYQNDICEEYKTEETILLLHSYFEPKYTASIRRRMYRKLMCSVKSPYSKTPSSCHAHIGMAMPKYKTHMRNINTQICLVRLILHGKHQCRHRHLHYNRHPPWEEGSWASCGS